jgi:hypothetical protein
VLFCLLFVVWLIVKLIWWILGAAALVVVFLVVRAVVRENRKRRDALARYCAEVSARADQHLNWVVQGDDRGIYGEGGAELMHYIFAEDAHTAPKPEPPASQWRYGPFGTRFKPGVAGKS